MLAFPDGFIWGAATSAYQIEGSPHADGAGMSIQHRFAHTPGNVIDGGNGDVAADHYRRFRKDVAIMRELGLQTYQFSIAWPRVLPEGTGTVNRKGLDFYDQLVDTLLEAGVAPAPILYVWDMPAVLQDRGGWANRDSTEWFAEYAQIVFERLGDRATHWFTICEPTSIAYGGYQHGRHAPAIRDLYASLRAVHHVLVAHGRAVQAFRASRAQGKIGNSTLVVDVRAASSSAADVAAAERMSTFYNTTFLDPVMLGEYPPGLPELYGDAWPPIADGDLAVISTPIDFLGITYYIYLVATDADQYQEDEDAALAADDGGSAHEELILRQIFKARTVPLADKVTAAGGPIAPDGLFNALTWLRDRYDNPPVIMAENGAAFPDVVTSEGKVQDTERIAYLRDYLTAAHRAIQAGVDLRGWFVWSLLDTWEFRNGYTGRYGLVHVDYETQRRTIKNSGYWFRDVMAANGLEGNAGT